MYQRGSTISENEPKKTRCVCPLKVFRVALDDDDLDDDDDDDVYYYIRWEVKAGGKSIVSSMNDVGGAVLGGSTPPFLGRERAAVDVDVGPERRSPRYLETCLALRENLQGLQGFPLFKRTLSFPTATSA